MAGGRGRPGRCGAGDLPTARSRQGEARAGKPSRSDESSREVPGGERLPQGAPKMIRVETPPEAACRS